MSVKRIYQIADLHIPTYNRLDVYGEQMEKLVLSIQDDIESSGLESDEVRIAICGDLVHSKNIVTNELTTFASSLVRGLSSEADVICIAGNHDMIDANSARMDTLSGIFQTAQFEHAKYLDMELGYKSGIVYDDNITWALYSFFDDFSSPDIIGARAERPDNIVIGLYHGMIVGSKLFNGFVSDCGNDKDLFDGCDAVMAGHVHKRQVIKTKSCDIVYAGSPIQQNFGESISQHGYAIWDIPSMEHKFVDIPNDYSYYDFSIESLDDIKQDIEVIRNY